MEPTSVQSRRRGTLEHPEVLDDVPGHVIPILEREFDDFDTESGRFLDGQTPETEFIGFRLKQGVYGQRQAAVQMIRVKLPFGGVTPDQMDAFADAVETYAPLNKGHITTRQNVQIHHVPLDDAAKFIRDISASGLSSREGCGNTVRNVTADPWAGVCEDETFDPTPYVGAYVRYFVRHPTTQLMPRKVKTAFTGSDADRSITGIHDIAYLARERDGKQGFEVRVGGGTSIMPRIAPTLYDFVEAGNGDYLKVAEAVFRIFDRQDWLRKNRARARLKVFVDKFGIDELRTQVEAELQGDWVAERDFTPDLFLHDEEASVRAQAGGAAAWAARGQSPGPNGDRTAFDRWASSALRPQRQAGYVTAHVHVPRGDLTPEQFRGLGQLMRDFSGGNARMTVHQNLVLRWVPEEAAHDVWQRLRALDLGRPGADEVTDVVSCPGTDSCKLGITASMGLNLAIRERLDEIKADEDPLVRRMHIKMSGCPNGCSQHHIADLGFYGASLKVGEHTVPAYIAHVGGQFDAGEVGYGTRLKVRLPAKRVPEAVDRWLALYREQREDGEPFRDFAPRVGTQVFEAAVSDLTMPIEFGLDTMNHFIDWSRNVPFQVIRGEGECAV